MSDRNSDGIKILGKPVIISMKDFFLKSELYQIPPYQRQYTWGLRQVDDYWNDIFKTLNVTFNLETSEIDIEVIREHFLGNVFLRRLLDSDTIEVVDGQQRITTTFLIIFSLLNKLSDYLKTNELTEEYQLTVKKLTEELRRILYPNLSKNMLRLRLGEIDDELFVSIALSTKKGDLDIKTLEKELSSKKIIQRNYSKICSLIDEKIDYFNQLNQHHMNDGKTESHLDELQSILKLLEAVLLALGKTLILTFNYITGDDGDSFLMFEAINARGKPLSQIDTIKNHIFGIAFAGDVDNGADLYELAKRTWKSLIMTHDEKAEDLLYYFFAVEFAKKTKLTQDKLYEFVVDHIKESDNPPASEVNNILRRLNDYILIFKFVIKPNSYLFSEIFPNSKNDKKVTNIIQEIQFINGHQIMMPFVLKTLFDLRRGLIDVITVAELINSSVNLYINIQLDKEPISKYIDLIPKFARDVSSQKTNKSLILAIKEHMNKHGNQTYQKLIYDISDREEMIDRIIHSRNEELNKLILTKLEISLRGTSEPILDSSVFWLEHIFPRKFTSSVYWQSFFNDFRITELEKGYDDSQILKEFTERFIDNIGNMVVSSDKVNSEAGIKPFGEKVNIYREHDGYLLRELVNKYGAGDFRAEQIRSRSKEIANKILDSNLIRID